MAMGEQILQGELILQPQERHAWVTSATAATKYFPQTGLISTVRDQRAML